MIWRVLKKKTLTTKNELENQLNFSKKWSNVLLFRRAAMKMI